MSQAKCVLCDRPDVRIQRAANRDALVCECPSCGDYLFTEQSIYYLEKNKERRYVLSSLTRRASDSNQRLELLSTSVPEFLSNAITPRTPREVLDSLILAIHAATTDLTGYTQVRYDDYPLYVVRDTKQLGEFLGLLARTGFIEVKDRAEQKEFIARLTLTGWDLVEQLRTSGRSSSRAFVAMSFAKELDEVYEKAIAPALSDTGWTPIRLDRLEHNDRIDDRIVSEIKKAGMLVADFTGNRQGVYFEAGLAAGLGLPVIWTVRESDLPAVHFDTRQYNHIVWTSLTDLHERLRDRIAATVERPHARGR